MNEKPRADRDRFGSVGETIVSPDRTCLGCFVAALLVGLMAVGCGVFYYYANPAFHHP